MDFSLTEEQRLLKDAVERFLEKNYSLDLRRKLIAERQTMSAPIWEGFAALGLLGVSLPAEYGGFGGKGIETMLVAEAFGRHLVIEPYLSTVVLAGGLVQTGAADWQKKILLPRIVDGTMLLAFAHFEPGSRYALNHVAARATPDGNNWILTGEKTLVLHGPVAEKLIVSARTSGSDDDPGGVTLFVVECSEENLAGQEYPLIDGTRALDVQLNGVRVGPESVIGTLDGALPLIERVVDRAMAALCAEAVGAMSRLHEMTVEYLKTRQQFGVPIGCFQVLQHRAVDMLIQVEQARSMAMLAAGKVDATDRYERRRAVTAAKEFIGRAGRFVAQQAIQLHGGMGMTDELAVGHYFKRLMAIDILFGDSAWQRRQFAELREDEVSGSQFLRPRSTWKQI
ncbi:MAG TPA: acyl-CoA dehydrogenase family protein [Burkholderiales bacterium]|nr:acyl-CoA dehydrogenase family protein [Burkholderiales bacterium]